MPDECLKHPGCMAEVGGDYPSSCARVKRSCVYAGVSHSLQPLCFHSHAPYPHFENAGYGLESTSQDRLLNATNRLLCSWLCFALLLMYYSLCVGCWCFSCAVGFLCGLFCFGLPLEFQPLFDYLDNSLNKLLVIRVEIARHKRIADSVVNSATT